MDSSNFPSSLSPGHFRSSENRVASLWVVLTSSNANTVVNNNDYQPSPADVSLHGGMEFEICTRINPISFKGSSIISTLGECSPNIHTNVREREREMLDTNELGLNGVLSGHDLLKIGPCARVGPPDSFHVFEDE